MSLNESIVEDAALEWFGELGYAVGHGPHLAPGEPAAERDSFGDVVLAGRLHAAIQRLNPAIPEEAREEALRKVLPRSAAHRTWVEGIELQPDGHGAVEVLRIGVEELKETLLRRLLPPLLPPRTELPATR